MFSRENHHLIKEKNPEMSIGEISRVLSERYKLLTPAERERY
jgi:hypothetical protein